ncbi:MULTISPECIES: HutD family protein [unclassified Shewanella]|uniref:HutD/Ves family protein n=1 Tax=unclassified Shewanella TaxID=196818 RepID=UPI0021D85EA9|nr:MULTISPECIES: HutD family protein [unclassified Shewanella]MCU8022009.1 HutD family protein [Shewanella sp. SM78]MCU8079299.1 HutD family protein [Shewanella sp. SM103]
MNNSIQLIRYQDCPSTPWKNSGGSTKQLLISPINAELTEFDYRISIASISSNGPFSSFIDIDRQLLILEGDGVELSINSHEGTKQINGLGAGEKISGNTNTTEYKRLTPADSPFCFAGETSITSQLLGSDVIDFNVMTKRGAFKAHTQRLSFDDIFIEEQIATSNSHPNELQKTESYVPIIQILCCLDTMTWEHNGKVIKIMPYDVLVFQQGDGIRLKTTMPSRLLKVSITASPL